MFEMGWPDWDLTFFRFLSGIKKLRPKPQSNRPVSVNTRQIRLPAQFAELVSCIPAPIPSSHKTSVMRSRLTAIAVCLWAAGLAAGFAAWMDYDTTPGQSALATASVQEANWVQNSPRYRLVMFAHPHCPCTQASLTELERIAAEFQVASTMVYFCKPSDASGEEWEPTNVSVRMADLAKWDDGCKEAKRAGATTSGHLLLFHPDGTLLFSGGITRARGYAGESVGSEAVRSRLLGQTRELKNSPVFGCPLYDPQNSDS